jgi:hypothetical protein
LAKNSVSACFIANQRKTITYKALADVLESRGNTITWVSPGTIWAEWLTTNGIAAGKVINIAQYGREWDKTDPLTDAEQAELRALEEASGEKIKRLILSDRFLRNKPANYALRYLLVAARKMEEFFKTHDVKFVFAEHTWSLELLSYMVCCKLGINFHVPMTVRVPSGRIAFFRGIDNAYLEEVGRVSPESREFAPKFLDEFRNQAVQPYYVSTLKNYSLPKLNWIRKFGVHMKLEQKKKYDETAFTLDYLIAKRIRELRNIIYARAFKVFKNPEEYLGKPYILVVLHTQPEASVDVLGRAVNNQLEMITAICKSVPSDIQVIVKEHKLTHGWRAPKVYRALNQLPGLIISEPNFPMRKLLSNALVTVSISGTPSLEAALLGANAVAVADMFYRDIVAKTPLNPYSDELSDVIARIRSGRTKPAAKHKLLKFIAWLHANSFECWWDDPVSLPKTLDAENITNLADAFEQLFTVRG